MTHRPQISLYLRTYSDDSNYDWAATLATARAMDAAGVDRVVVSDHVVFGEHLEAYGRPESGGVEGGNPNNNTAGDSSAGEPIF